MGGRGLNLVQRRYKWGGGGCYEHRNEPFGCMQFGISSLLEPSFSRRGLLQGVIIGSLALGATGNIQNDTCLDTCRLAHINPLRAAICPGPCKLKTKGKRSALRSYSKRCQ